MEKTITTTSEVINLDRKKAEKELSLHLNVLSRLAIGRDVDISIVDKGKGTYCDLSTNKIFIEEVSEDIEILLGLGFHELGHVLATAVIDYQKEYKIKRDECAEVHDQVNSLEDYRIENRISQLYPPAEYYLKKLAYWFRLDYIQEQKMGAMTTNPSYILHLLLGNVDLTKFVKKIPRKIIRELRKELNEKEFYKFKSTRDIVPLAIDAYNRLKPYQPKDATRTKTITGFLEEDDEGDIRQRGKPILEEIKDGQVLLSPPKNDKADPTPLLTLHGDIKKANEDATKTKALGRGKPPGARKQTDYVRPYTPRVQTIRTSREDINKSWKTQCITNECKGIDEEIYSETQGARIGRELAQQLRFKDAERHRLEDGELNVDTVIEVMQENRGRLTSFEVFSDETPLIHDHTVAILIDMSGSMSVEPIGIARSAALMLSKALEEMNIVHTIRGFGAVSGELSITDFVIKDFGEPLDKNKLRTMYHGDVNRDSDSIRNAVELLKSERGKKLVFIISDGHPNHNDGVDDYRAYNKQSYMDVYNVVREAERDGVSVIGIGIEADASQFISETYLKGFHIEKIGELPEKLIDIYLKESQSFRKV